MDADELRSWTDEALQDLWVAIDEEIARRDSEYRQARLCPAQHPKGRQHCFHPKGHDGAHAFLHVDAH